jgi:transposase
MSEFTGIYVGMDVHKETIAVAVARPGRDAPEYVGEIAHDGAGVRKLLKRLTVSGEALHFCYEAGPCGYGLYRQLTGLGHRCDVVAPSLIPRKAGDRLKTDRRDALQLARLHRAGELTGVWVPDEEQEALRDVTRAREDMMAMALQARQRLSAFLLRHGQVYREGKSRWTQKHFRWLLELRFSSPLQQLVFEEYVETVKAALRRVEVLEGHMREVMDSSPLRPVVEALMALRGVSLVTALTVVAELGDITRFDSPRQLMAYLGLVPSEHSSGGTRRQGGITRTGNGHVRRVLVEAAWNYRFMARKSRVIEARAQKTAVQIQAIAWEGQKRLCHRYRQLMEAGKQKNQVTVAVARELAGFIWAIACEVVGKPHGSKVLA